jgi:hypothetical protein
MTVEYVTILWPYIKGYSSESSSVLRSLAVVVLFSFFHHLNPSLAPFHSTSHSARCGTVETAGNILDRDSELVLYFNLPDSHNTAEGFPRNSRTRMKMDFRSGRVDLLAVQRFVSDKLLGPDAAAPSRYAGNAMWGGGHAGAGPVGATPASSSAGGLLAFLGDDNRMIDTAQANRQFHTEQPILQGCEDVELAFRGRRDMLLFTTKRVIFVDVKGFMGLGKKVEYTSLPYSTITSFSVRSAGSWADKDSELCLWLDFDDVFYPPRENEDDPPPPPIPRKSWLEIDFQKDKVDILVVHRYLSERVMRTNGHTVKPYTSAVSPNLLVPSPPGSRENLLDWIGENAAAIDADAVNQKFHELGILQHDERVAFAFKTGRDSLYLTNKRFFMIDVQVRAWGGGLLPSSAFGVPMERKYSKGVIAHGSLSAQYCRDSPERGENTCPSRGIQFVCGRLRVREISIEIWR